MQRIEFAFFDAGGGHRAAATALKTAIEQQGRPWDVRLCDVQGLLDHLDILKKYTGVRIQDFYNGMLRGGWTLGSRQLLKVLQLVVRAYHEPAVRAFEEHWREVRPEMVVSFVPHFNRALFESFQRVCPGRPFVTVLTDLADYPPHFWMEPQPQHFICGTDFAVLQALAMGHPQERVLRASGMILHPKFYAAPVADRAAERAKLGLRADVPTALVLFGGHGSRAMLGIARRIERWADVQLILICGRNERLAAKLRAQKSSLPRHVEGFTTRVEYFMQLADFFIGKPGPGSVSEALAMKLPVIIECNAWTLPQERYNAEWVAEKGAGVVLHDFRHAGRAVTQMTAPGKLEAHRARAAALENFAVFEIPAMLEKILREGFPGRGAAGEPESREQFGLFSRASERGAVDSGCRGEKLDLEGARN